MTQKKTGSLSSLIPPQGFFFYSDRFFNRLNTRSYDIFDINQHTVFMT